MRPDTVLVPIPPSAVAPDTLPPDSVRAAAQDTTPVPSFPRFPEPLATGWAFSRWEWGPEALARYQGLTLLEFLQRTPGLTLIRGGDIGYPVGITALGLGGGRVRVFIDGFELDPLGYASFDPQQIPTIDLESVRIERQLTGIRIELNTIRLSGNQPLSVVEAGTGVYESKLVRGLLVRGIGRRNIVTAAYDAATTQGFGFRSPFSLVSARIAWSYALSARTGVQLELRKTGVERLGESAPENADHRLVLLRARSELRPGLMLDAAVGKAWREPRAQDLLTRPLTSSQGMVRASYSTGLGRAEATVRLRDTELESSTAARLEIGGLATVRPRSWLTGEGELRTASLGGVGGIVWQSTVRAGTPGSPAAFISLGGGTSGVGLVRDSIRTSTLATDTFPAFSALSSAPAALRLGAELTRADFSAGLAAVALTASFVAPFGNAFDRQVTQLYGAATTGYEAQAAFTVPRTGGMAQLEGWGTYWPHFADRPYLPRFDTRGAAILHGWFYSGQLEPSLRFEISHRGASSVPGVASGAEEVQYTRTLPYTLTNLILGIRILSVQAFGRWDNLLDYRQAQEIPGLTLPGQRLVYGIRWEFRD